MLGLARALIEVGQSIHVTRKVDVEQALPCATAVREGILDLARVKREKYNKDLADVVRVGGGITCDGLKNELTGDKFYDFVLHYIEISPHPHFLSMSSWKLV